MDKIKELMTAVFSDEPERKLIAEENEVNVQIKKVTSKLEDCMLPDIEILMGKLGSYKDKFLMMDSEAYYHLEATLTSIRHLILKNGEWYFYFLGDRRKKNSDLPTKKGAKCARHNAADEGPMVSCG
jgi:hypothetical protein